MIYALSLLTHTEHLDHRLGSAAGFEHLPKFSCAPPLHLSFMKHHQQDALWRLLQLKCVNSAARQRASPAHTDCHAAFSRLQQLPSLLA